MLNKSCFNNLKYAPRGIGIVVSECMECLQDQIIMQDYSTDLPLHIPFSYFSCFPFLSVFRDDLKNSKKVVAVLGRSKYFTSEKPKFLAMFTLDNQENYK